MHAHGTPTHAHGTPMHTHGIPMHAHGTLIGAHGCSCANSHSQHTQRIVINVVIVFGSTLKYLLLFVHPKFHSSMKLHSMGLFYSETRVLAETPLVGETPTKWEKSSDRCWPVYHMPYGEAVRSQKATELHRFDCYLLLSHAWCLQTHLILQTTV